METPKKLIFSHKKAFLIFQETELYLSGNGNPKKLINFLYFEKWNFLVPYFKNSCFFRTPYGFSSVSSGVFISPLIFTIVFQVFSFHQLSLPWLIFARYFAFVLYRECYRLESFFYTQAFFTLNFFPTFSTTCFYQRLPREPAILRWRLNGLLLRFERQTWLICLFESQSGLLKVLVGRFYLCIKDLRNTISTSSKFWTHYLIAKCIVKRVSYPLDHKSSCWLLLYKCI